MVTLDYDRVRDIIQTARHGYYEREHCRIERQSAFAPSIDDVFARVCTPRSRVLDIGCGNGRTLLRNASRFGEGIGLDNDPEHLRLAQQHLCESGVTNVRFIEGRADNLRRRFEPESFDFIYTERGPLPGSDVNTYNATSLLKHGGTLMAESPGPLGLLEVGLLFGTPMSQFHPVPEHSRLDALAAQFARHGITVQFTCSILEKLVFPDFYHWLRFHLSTWDYYDEWRLTWPLPVEIRHGIERFLSVVMGDQGQLRITNHRWWTIGIKP